MAKQELTIKQRKFIKFFVETGSLTEACEKAGYKVGQRKTLCSIGIENLEKLRDRIEPILSAKGLDGFAVADVLDDARKAIYFSGKKELPDHKIRLEAADKISKLKGLYAAEKKAIMGENGGPIQLKVVFDKKKGSVIDGD